MTSCCRKAHEHLEAVVDEPLEGCQGSDLWGCAYCKQVFFFNPGGLQEDSVRGEVCVYTHHCNPDGQTVPQSFEPDVAVDS